MGTKVNLAMQNQYVEFAKKDGEGNDIAEGIKALQQAISGVVAFDGEVNVTKIGGDWGITKANIPTASGVYKKGSAVLCVTKADATHLHLIAIYDGQIYAQNRTTSDNTNFIFGESTRMGDKPIYYHPIYLADSDGETLFRIQLLILDNSPTPYTTSTIIAKLKDLLDNGALININGPYRTSGENNFANAYLFYKVGSSYALYTYDQSNLNLEDFSFIENHLGTCLDGVNRIN